MKKIISILILFVAFGIKAQVVGGYVTGSSLTANYVPYTGATKTVNLGSQILKTTGPSTLGTLYTGAGTFTGQVTASNVISAGTASFGTGTSTFNNVVANGTGSFVGAFRTNSTFTSQGVITASSQINATGVINTMQYFSWSSGDAEIRTITGEYGLRLRGYNTISGVVEDKILFQSNRAKTGANFSFSFTPTSFTNQTASTEAPMFAIGAGTIGHATGAISGARDFYMTTITHSAVGASTLTNMIGAEFSAATAGSNVTLVNPIAIHSKGSFSITSGRFAKPQGADVASATGSIALGFDGNVFEITGTNAITLIESSGWGNGSEVTLLFTSTASLTDGTANSGTLIGFELAGNANFSGSADDSITLTLCEIGGTVRWREKCRSVN